MNRLTHKDTAIVDSGFFVRVYTANARSSANLLTPLSSDSLVQFWGDDTLDIRTSAISKGLELPSAPWAYLVITRWDTDSDTLDFKDSSGSPDSSAMEFSITTEK